jgi:hypothetical protein
MNCLNLIPEHPATPDKVLLFYIASTDYNKSWEYIALNCGPISEQWISKDTEGRDHDLI